MLLSKQLHIRTDFLKQGNHSFVQKEGMLRSRRREQNTNEQSSGRAEFDKGKWKR